MSNGTSAPLKPSDWFQLSSQSVLENYNITGWPWTRLTFDEFFGLLTSYEIFRDYYAEVVTQRSLWALCVIGVIGSILIVFTIAKMPKAVRTSFYKITNMIAVFDALYLIDIVIRQRLHYMKERTTAVLVPYLITSGTVFCFSLMGDLLTLALSVERFVALTFPVWYKRMNKQCERRLWSAIIAISTLLAACRVHYAIGNTRFIIHAIADTAFFAFLKLFSDFVLPVILAVLMILMVVGILAALIKRTCTKAAVHSKDIDKHIANCMKSMSLLAVLMTLFLLCQLGYIVFELAYISRSNANLRYDCDFAEADRYRRLAMNVALTGDLNIIAEAISKSFNFYQYVMFNSSFRNYFFALVKRQRVADSNMNAGVTAVNEIPINRPPKSVMQ